MPENVGDTILQAAQGIVRQFEQQNQMELNMLAFSQQVETQKQNFALKEEQFAEQKKLNDLRTQQIQLQTQQLQDQNDIFSAAGGPGAAADLQTRTAEATIRLRNAQAAQGEASLNAQQGDGVTASQRFQMRKDVFKLGRQLHERQVVTELATADARMAPFVDSDLGQIRSARAELLKLQAPEQQLFLTSLNKRGGTNFQTPGEYLELTSGLLKEASALLIDEPPQQLLEQAHRNLNGSAIPFEILNAGPTSVSVDDRLNNLLGAEVLQDASLRARATILMRDGDATGFAAQFGQSLLDPTSATPAVSNDKTRELMEMARVFEPDQAKRVDFVAKIINTATGN